MHEGDLVGGRYRLTALLGRGAMGKVFDATDERLRRRVAVKVVDLTQTTDRTVAERFRREAVAIAQLNHPGIVTIFDAGSDDRTAWLVMERLGGRPLSDVLREGGPLPQARAVEIGRRVAEALVATHLIGVVHRDIKPANIMVDHDTVKLLDFGIALVSLDAEANLTAPATTLGTAAYMSPEQASGRRASAASDVYALGGVLVAMLTGQPPYPGDNAIQVAQRHITEPPVSVRSRRPEVTPALDDLLVRMMAKDPQARPTAAVVAQALAHLATNPAAAATAVLPPVAAAAAASAVVGAPPPTAILPASTAALPPATAAVPAAEGTRVDPGSAQRVPTAAEAGGPARTRAQQAFRTAALWLAILIAALLVFALAWAIGSQVSRGRAEASTAASAEPAPSPTAAPTSAPRTTAPTTPTVSLPTISLPSLPAVDEAALRAAVAGVDATLTTVLAGSGVDADTAESLQQAWSDASAAILTGDDPAQAVANFRETIDDERSDGNLGIIEAETIKVALSAVEALLPR